MTNGKQSFDQEPDSKIEVNPGQDVILPCRIYQKSRNSICNWQKDGYPISLQTGKYQWDGDKQRGDCSLKIFKADINFDNAEWVCQVSPSSFDSDDALSSRPARLIVRIPPSAPRIYHEGQFLTDETNLQVTAGKIVRLRCESRGGNPPAGLKWLIDEETLEGSSQKNETEVGDNRKWNAISVIEVAFSQEHHEKRLRCVSVHEAYPRRYLEQSTSLDILYAPVVRLEKPEGGFEFEANVDEIQLRCAADGNPAPNIFWRKAGGESILRLGDILEFKPVRESDGGSYFCWAKNEVGTSDELSVTFDVLYPPRSVTTDPQRLIDLDVGKSFEFKCDAQSNPPSKFEWMQKLPILELEKDPRRPVYSRGFGKSLILKNVSYEHEGMWACTATTVIKGRERKITSEPIKVEVVGKPQVSPFKANFKQDFPLHSKAQVKTSFCSDPKPRSLKWQWGSLLLLEGEEQGRFKASDIISDPNRKDCYLATLTIADMISSDSRLYFVTIANDRGETRYGINVRAVDPIPMVALVGVIATALSLILFIVFCVTYTFKAKKCCFKHKGPAFERDTNFRIYPNDHYIAEHLPAPPPRTMIDSRPTVPKEQPIGIPIYSTARGKSQKEPKFSINEPQMTSTPLNGTVMASGNRRRSVEPTYPLPPRSQFALGSNGNGAFRASGFGTNLRKTPQNVDLSPTTSGSPIFSDQMQQLNKSNESNERLFQSKLQANKNILLVGESQYYPRVTDRADV